MRALAEAGDDEDARKHLAVVEVLWRETKGSVPEMLVLMAGIGATLSAAFGPDAADTFRKAFDEAIPIAKSCIGPSVADQPAGAA
jgi:hypothetical protein